MELFQQQPKSYDSPWQVRLSPFALMNDYTHADGTASEMGVSSRTCRRPRVLRPKTCLPTIMNHSSAALYQQQQNPSGSSHSFGPPAGVFDGAKGEQFEIIDGSAGSSENGECRLKRQNSPASIPLQQQQPVGMSSPFEAFEHRLIDAVAKNLFGIFYHLPKPFFPSDEFPQRRRSPKTFVFYGLLIILLARGIYYFTQLGGNGRVSLEWARGSLQVSLTLNALGALAWMYKNGDADANAMAFPRRFAAALLSAIGQNRQPKYSMRSIITASIIAIFLLYTSTLWALLRVLQLHLNPEIKSNGSFALNLNGSDSFGFEALQKISFTCLDAFLAILAGFLSALALAIFYLSFQSVLTEWETFKREQIDVNINNSRLNMEILNQCSSSATALLRFAHFTSNKLEQLGMGMFMTAIFCSIAANFISGVADGANGNGENDVIQWPFYNVLDKINNVNWSIFSIVMLVTTLKGPYDVHAKIREIKEQLLLEESLWNNEDPKLTMLAQNLIRRLEGIRVHRIGTQLFQLVFIAQMVLVWLLVSGSSTKK